MNFPSFVGPAGSGKTTKLIELDLNYDFQLLSFTNATVKNIQSRGGHANTIHSQANTMLAYTYEIPFGTLDERCDIVFALDKLGYSSDNVMVGEAERFVDLVANSYCDIEIDNPIFNRFNPLFRIIGADIIELARQYRIKHKTATYTDCLELIAGAGMAIPRQYPQDETDIVYVDEFQDLSPLQFEALKAMYSLDNLRFAGDPCQAIFQFAGGSSKCVTVDDSFQFLETNYRSARRIIEVANHFRADGKTQSASRKNKGFVSLKRFDTKKSGIDWVCKQHFDVVLVRSNKEKFQLSKLGVTADTVHGSKGKEYKAVAVMLDGIPWEYAQNDDDLAVEQNILYTAITRACDKLTFVSSDDSNMFLAKVGDAVEYANRTI